MRILKVLLGIGMAIGFGALAQTAGSTSGSSQNPPVLPQSGSQTTSPEPTTDRDTATDQSDLGTGGSGDGGMVRHRGKHMGDGGMRLYRKHMADAGM